MNQKDRLFETKILKTGDFVFDDRVVGVFPDMINRSVPGYGLVVPMIGLLARQYAQDASNLYDLGCSLGAVSLAMRASVRARDARILAIDSSPGMIRQLRSVLQDRSQTGVLDVQAIRQDILETTIENASVVVLNFTLQFVEPENRNSLLNRIYHGLNPGGVLILSEKIRFENPDEQERQTRWHHEFKRAQGYSDLEIAQKRDALENVMKPDSMPQHQSRLRSVGFKDVYQWFQGFNFVSMVALRPPA